jgi:hypothetical protein
MKWQKTILFCMCVLFGSSLIVLAQDKVEFGFTSDFYSKYIWRGQVLDNKWVLQPSISASAYGFTGSIWGNMDLSDESKIVPDNAGEFSEFDFTFDYTAAVPGIENLNFSLGVIYYRFPNQIYHPTTEIYVGLGLSDEIFSPSITVYRDIDEIDGGYVQAGIGHTFEKIYVMNEQCYCDLQLNSSIGWGNAAYNRGYFNEDGSAFNDLMVNMELPFYINSWTISPSVSFSAVLGSDIRRATDKSDNVWIGIGLQKSF